MRTGESNNVQSVDSIPADADKQLYLANFEGGGFLLFGIDSTNTQPIGFSDKGSLQFSDTTKLPLLSMVFANASEMLATRNRGVIPSDGIDPNDPGSIRTHYYYKNTKWDHEYPPSTYGFFGQREPFNRFLIGVPFFGGEAFKYPAGCGPIAIATLLSHYRVQGIGGSQIDWNRLFSEYNSEEKHWGLKDDTSLVWNLAKMVADISNKCHISRGKGYTLSTRSNVKNYLGYVGFSAWNEGYNENSLIGYLRQTKAPVIMLGWQSSDCAHYWVVDGFVRKDQDKYSLTINTEMGTTKTEYIGVETTYYAHCVWGWEGDYNGWFNYNVFFYKYPDPSVPKPKSELRGGCDKAEGPYYDVEIFKVIKK